MYYFDMVQTPALIFAFFYCTFFKCAVKMCHPL